MSAVTMPSVSSLLHPRGLPPLKRPRKGRKARRALKKRIRAAEDETAGAATPTSPTDAAKGTSAPATHNSSSSPSANSTPSAKASTAVPAKTVGGRLFEAMKFRGGAPELINGRCAMMAIPTVIGYEMMEKETFLQLIANHKFLFWAAVGLISIASLIPIARGAKRFMTVHAELINGRAAMIGILGIILLEAKSGTHLF